MPEVTDNYVRIPNPWYSGQDWTDTVRTRWLSEDKGIKALWSPLVASGQWKIRTLLFARAQWANMEACEAWVREHRDALKGIANLMNTKVKAVELSDAVRGFGPTPSEDDLAIINDMALEPMEAKDVYVRRIRLANDRIDRDWERFSRGVLDHFRETLPGKSVLIGHNKGGEPVGRFYKSDVVRDPATGTTWLNGYWYAPVTAENEHDRKAIDSGVWSYASIGFQWDWAQCDLCGNNYRAKDCGHILGETYPTTEAKGRELGDLAIAGDAVRCTVTYRGDAQAMEGSLVYLGAQYDAQIIKAKMVGDLAEEKRLLLEADNDMNDGDAVAKGAGDGALDGDTSSDGDTTGATGEPDQASGTGTGQTDDKEATSMSDELTEKLAQAEAALSDTGEKLKAAEAETDALRTRCAELRDPVVAEIATLGAALKRGSELADMQRLAGEKLENMPDDMLLARRDAWREELEKGLPGRRQSSTEDPNADIVDATKAAALVARMM